MTSVDPGDFSTALVDYLPKLRRYAVVLVGNLSAADDLVQDCIERALARSETLQDSHRIGAWLRSILHNLHTDELRRRARRGVGLDISEMDNDIALSTPHAGAQTDTRDFQRAFESLSTEHKQILLLVGVEDLGYREVSEELGIPIGTVMSRLARARERLRQAMEQEVDMSSTIQPLALRRAAP